MSISIGVLAPKDSDVTEDFGYVCPPYHPPSLPNNDNDGIADFRIVRHTLVARPFVSTNFKPQFPFVRVELTMSKLYEPGSHLSSAVPHTRNSYRAMRKAGHTIVRRKSVTRRIILPVIKAATPVVNRVREMFFSRPS